MFETDGIHGEETTGPAPAPPAAEHRADASTGDPVSLARAALAAVEALARGADATFAPGWAFEERATVITALDRIGELTGVYRARVLTAHRDDGRWASQGDRSFVQHRGRTTGAGPGVARAELEFAEGLAALPEAARAVEDEQVSVRHAEVLTRLRARSSARVKHALERGGAAELLGAAAEMDVPTFARRAASWAAAQDVDAAERSFAAVRARRYLRLVDRDGGGVISGFVDPVVLATLRTAVESHAPVPAAGDERTPEQRAADALDALAQASLGAGAAKIGAQIRPHISLIVSEDTWTTVQRRRQRQHGREHDHEHEGAHGRVREPGHGHQHQHQHEDAHGHEVAHGREDARERGREREDGRERGGRRERGGGGEPGRGAGERASGPPTGPGSPSEGTGSRAPARPRGVGSSPTDRGQVLGEAGGTQTATGPGMVVLPELDDGTVVPLSELERIACDCEITRLVLGADGIPLDVGQSQRTYSQGLRRAILARDGHCQWPGCTMRASWCQVHHIRWYSRGGLTSLDNGLALCVFHHHEVHRRDIAITPGTGGVRFTRRDGTTIGTTPRDSSARRMLATSRSERRKASFRASGDAGGVHRGARDPSGGARRERSAGTSTAGGQTASERGPSPPTGGLF